MKLNRSKRWLLLFKNTHVCAHRDTHEKDGGKQVLKEHVSI